MKKSKIIFLVFLSVHALCGSLFAQSKAAYLKAGDKCLEGNDPFCALSNYRQALDYGEHADVCFRLGMAEKLLHNYRESLNWYQRGLTKSSDQEETRTALIAAADLNKRLGDFEAAQRCLDALIVQDAAQTIKWNSLKNAYQEAEKNFHDSAAVEIIPLGGNINTAYSDFAPSILGDSLLYFSSLRYFNFQNSEKIATSKIAVSSIREALPQKPRTLEEEINVPSFNNANSSLSPDGKIMVFSRCQYDEKGKLICSLYESRFLNDMWQDAVKLSNQINPAGKSSTQPCISTNKSEGYLLFFSSNKSGGEGGMDIWYCKRLADGRYETPVNAGKQVNKEGDEWSPFYDAESDSLYFSTERDNGLGGLDFYVTSFPRITQNIPDCLHPPFNSGYNDLYLTRSYGQNPRRFLVSNRPPAIRLNGSSCCYDIFSITPADVPVEPPLVQVPELKTDTSAIPAKSAFATLTIREKIADINLNFPLRLYFDNDQPDPKSRLRTTLQQYDELADNYLKRAEEYIEKQESGALKELITGFFTDSVKANFLRLNAFTEKLFETLYSQNKGVKITIQGSASPLADSRYNLILSGRRIESLLNYWRKWENGKLNEMISQKKLEIVFIPAGEEKSARGISDKLNDQLKSVYSKEAALERRIELVEMKLME